MDGKIVGFRFVCAQAVGHQQNFGILQSPWILQSRITSRCVKLQRKCPAAMRFTEGNMPLARNCWTAGPAFSSVVTERLN